MKTQKTKSLKLVKASIASLETKTINEVKGGRPNSFRTICITSCVSH
ncbi:hypothetical protein KORDIASMS9_01568 [Kordia sp. SMS9]|nr:hypothetical protein [Kordia sp. SMS9]AXG69348.1 hypothetical protein KORDIASMS9_01568 [Kordia sp. SMS9]